MIYRFQPFSPTKELGKVYNAHCALVPNLDDWILITDHDVLFLVPETHQVIERAIEQYPQTQIFGAVTNRIGYSFQRLEKNPCLNDSVKYHMEIAKRRSEFYGDGMCMEARTLAGFFLLFRKSYWLKNPFQEKIYDAKGKCFDFNFCRNAKKMRVILGAYLWHSYRLTKDNFRDKSHLR